jgi:AcrR family transcriptional regulator
MASARMKSNPRWLRRKDERPRELVAAALQLFVERGFAATRLEDVAARAGVSKGTLYLYFASKEDLFRAVVRRGLVESIEIAERQVREFRGGSIELLDALLRRLWDVLVRSPYSGIPKLVIAEAGNFPELARFYFDEVIYRGLRLVAAVIEGGIEAGELSPADLRHLPRVAVAPIVMAAVWKHSFAALEETSLWDDAYLETHLATLFHGVARNHPDGESRSSHP